MFVIICFRARTKKILKNEDDDLYSSVLFTVQLCRSIRKVQ